MTGDKAGGRYLPGSPGSLCETAPG